MNRSNEAHFTNLPMSDLKFNRSRFDLGHTLYTSFNVGDLIPFDIKEVYPGDTWKVSTKSIIRLETLLKPIFSDLFFDYYYFFVPHRLTWDHWEEFLGAVSNEPWKQSTEYTVPQTTAPSETGWDVNSLANYLGVPINTSGISISSLVFRGYCKIYNDWFRNQNYQYELDYNTSDEDVVGSNGSSETTAITTAIKGGQIPKINKFRDYFTSCLPEAQRGDPIQLPIGSSANIVATNDMHSTNNIIKFGTGRSETDTINYNLGVARANGSIPNYLMSAASVTDGTLNYGIAQTNLISDLSTATGVSINDVRNAFALQRILERSARNGSRYFEYLLSAFGVNNGDLRLGRSEYLGGCRVDINVNEVLQTTPTDSSALGNEAAHSVSANYNYDFTKSFTEHGYLYCVGAVRYVHSYDRGIPRFMSRKRKYDFYDTALAFLGEQPVLNKEIFAQGNNQDDEALGYNEAWADLRFSPNTATGMMRTNYSQSLDIWHLTDKYNSRPTMSADFVVEDKSNVDRVIAVSSEGEAATHQLIAAFKFYYDVYRVLPSYSIPQLIS